MAMTRALTVEITSAITDHVFWIGVLLLVASLA